MHCMCVQNVYLAPTIRSLRCASAIMHEFVQKAVNPSVMAEVTLDNSFLLDLEQT